MSTRNPRIEGDSCLQNTSAHNNATQNSEREEMVAKQHTGQATPFSHSSD
jgi:hypothetical protein